MTQLTGKRGTCHSTGCHHYCEPTIRRARATALQDTCMIRFATSHVEYATGYHKLTRITLACERLAVSSARLRGQFGLW